jgi:hypothetical protein
MYSTHPHLAETLVKDRQRELHRVAGNSRLYRQAKNRRPRQRRGP